jgi:predicted nucleotidyltransferase/DNA-binding XRE family transcriptional regulator
MNSVADIGTALIEARRASGLTQAGLAERLGVKRQQVQRWESRGYRSASLERVSQVAAALGFDALVLEGAVRLTQASAASPTDGAAGVHAPVRELGDIVARVRSHGAELRDGYGVSKLGVFGSFADARQTEDSDVDCLVEFDESSAADTRKLEEYLRRILGRDVDVTTEERLRWEIRADVTREVVRVWAA